MPRPTGRISPNDPIDWGHPDNRGLVGRWLGLPGRVGNVSWDATGRYPLTLVNGPTWEAIPCQQMGIRYASASSQYAATTYQPTGITAAAIACWWRRTSVLGTFPAFCGLGLGASSQGLGLLQLNTGAIYTELVTSAGGSTVTAAAGNDAGWHRVVASWDGAALSLWVDGLPQGTASRAGTMSPSTVFQLGRRSNGGVVYANGTVSDAILYVGRSVDDGWARRDYAWSQDITRDPRLRRVPDLAWLPAPGGGGGGFRAPWLARGARILGGGV